MTKLKILALSLLTYSIGCAQLPIPTDGHPVSTKVGFNQPNTAESVKTEADSLLFEELIPTGGSFSWRDRFDKHNEDPQDIVNIYKRLEKTGRSFSAIFVGTDSVGFDNAAAISTLKSAGVYIPVAEFVNEAFYPAGGFSFNWSDYEPKLEAFIAEVASVDPTIRIGIPIAPKPSDVFTKEEGGQASHKTWNQAAFNFIANHPETSFGLIIHIYYTGSFVPELGPVTTDETGKADKIKKPTSRIYNYQTDTLDEGYWRNIFYQSNPALFWDRALDYLATNGHGAKTYVTECGYIGAGSLNGTWTFAAKAFELVNLYGADPRLESFNFHAGFTKSRVGMIGPRKANDIRDPENPYNVTSPTFDAFALYFHAPGLIYKYRPDLQLTEPGTYSLWFLNGGEAYTPTINLATGLEASFIVKAVTGHRFSSAGATMEFMKPGSTLGAEEVTRIDTLSNCPRISFGYIEVTVTRTPIYGCTDAGALNYNPEANTENTPSDCFYFSDCGCKDATALNFDAAAPCQDNTKCEYQPENCYKKRWLFKGCKPDPTCRFNNCTPGTSLKKSNFTN